MGVVGTVYLSGCNYQVGYDLISQSVENNTSYVKFWGILNVTNSYVSWSSGKATVWGASANLNTRYNKGSYLVVQQYVTLYHNADGTYSHSLGGTLSTTYVSGTAQGTFSLPTIPRASQPSCITWPNTTSNVGAIGGDPFLIHMNRKSTAFTHTVRYSWYNKSGTIATNVTDNCQWAIPADFAEDIPDRSTSWGQIFVDTYNGSTFIGTKSVVFYCNVVNSNPTFNCAYLDTNSTSVAITQNNQQLIQNISTLRVNITDAEALNYATLSSAKVTINGVDYEATLSGSSVSIDVGTLNIAQNIDASVTVIDSRNLSTTKTLNLQILEWQQPNAIITLNRQSNYYSETDIKVDANYSSLDNKNTITIQVRYKKTSDSSYGAYQTLQDNVTSVLTLDNLYQWDVQVKLTDRTNAVTTYNLSIDKGMPIFYIDRLKNSLGLECFPENNNSLEINGDIFITDKYDSNKYKIYNNYEYSTTKETIVGVWVDSKPIYKKTFYVSSLPNNNWVNKAHNISNIDMIIDIQGIMRTPSNGTTVPINFSGTSALYGAGNALCVRADRTNIVIGDTTNWSSNEAYIHLFYTKTTD